MQHSNIYDLRCLCLVSIDIIFSSMCSTEVASTYGIKAKPSLVQDFWMNLKLESLNFTQYLFFFDGAGFELFPIFFEMSWFLFTVPVLLGNNQKTGLKWKQNLVSPNKYEYGAENLKDIWRFRYTISVNYVSFWKFKNRAGNKLKLRKRQSPSSIFIQCSTSIPPKNIGWKSVKIIKMLILILSSQLDWKLKVLVNIWQSCEL